MTSRGFFIVFEGCEGSGKSTQAKVLYGRLCARRYPARLVREPGDTHVGEFIRGFFAAPRTLEAWSSQHAALVRATPGAQLASRDIFQPIAPYAGLLLFEASRAQLMAEKVVPYLDRGLVVVCDRFTYSTLAYQGYGEGQDLDHIRLLNEKATQGITPNCVVYLDIDPEKGLRRKIRSEEISRFEKEELEFHGRVRQGYLRLMAEAREPWIKIDSGARSKDEVADAIWEQLQGLLPPPRTAAPSRKPAAGSSLL